MASQVDFSKYSLDNTTQPANRGKRSAQRQIPLGELRVWLAEGTTVAQAQAWINGEKDASLEVTSVDGFSIVENFSPLRYLTSVRHADILSGLIPDYRAEAASSDDLSVACHTNDKGRVALVFVRKMPTLTI